MSLNSCGSKMNDLSSDLLKVTPNPLEVRGGNIDVKLEGTFPEKFFNKNAVLVVTPVLKFNDTEVRGTSKTFQGEKVAGNGLVVNMKEGGKFTMEASFKYVPEMAKSELYLDFDIAIKGKKVAGVPQMKVADGAIATEQLADAGDILPAILPDKFQRIIQESQEADIKFLIQQADLRNSETRSQAVSDLRAAMKDAQDAENKEIAGLDVIGYASPDGALDLNEGLAERRLNATANFLDREMKRLKADVEIGKDFVPEDWEGFQSLMEASSIQDKELVLRVLSMYTDPEQREREIKNIAAAFTSIADEILPQLRRSRMLLTVNIIGKSDEEITELAANNPDSLTVEELLYAATLKEDLASKADIYQKVANIYEQDVRGHNNLGAVQLQQGDIEAAAASLEKAALIEANNADVNFNLGLVALSKGDLDKAQEYFGNAAGTSGALGQALGTTYILKGDYAKAKTSFGSEISNNAALAQILTADYNAARRTLAAVAAPNALTSYLEAIVGARTNDRDVVYESLKAAIEKDNTVKEKVAVDIEFAKFADDETFQSIVN